ncbi:MAG TPA: hypothetical protein VKV73_26440 [Chloroflexota bacterium]|nr:hypothetical protein [Chloroflexota bacterium]
MPTILHMLLNHPASQTVDLHGWRVVLRRLGAAEGARAAGRTIPLVNLRIVDSELRDVPHDGVASGEVVVRAPWLTQGYFDDPVSSEVLWNGGYMHTGDIGTLDPQEYLLITDRIKDVIKSGGEWISSLQLEDILLECPGVSEAAVIAVPDERWGERAVAVVVPKRLPHDSPPNRRS